MPCVSRIAAGSRVREHVQCMNMHTPDRARWQTSAACRRYKHVRSNECQRVRSVAFLHSELFTRMPNESSMISVGFGVQKKIRAGRAAIRASIHSSYRCKYSKRVIAGVSYKWMCVDCSERLQRARDCTTHQKRCPGVPSTAQAQAQARAPASVSSGSIASSRSSSASLTSSSNHEAVRVDCS